MLTRCHPFYHFRIVDFCFHLCFFVQPDLNSFSFCSRSRDYIHGSSGVLLYTAVQGVWNSNSWFLLKRNTVSRMKIVKHLPGCCIQLVKIEGRKRLQILQKILQKNVIFWIHLADKFIDCRNVFLIDVGSAVEWLRQKQHKVCIKALNGFYITKSCVNCSLMAQEH